MTSKSQWLRVEKNFLDGHDGPAHLKFTIFQSDHFFKSVTAGFVYWKRENATARLQKKYKPGDGSVVCLCCVATCVEDSSIFFKKHGSCVVMFFLLHAFSQIHGFKTQKNVFRQGDIAYLAYIAKCAVSGLSRLS